MLGKAWQAKPRRKEYSYTDPPQVSRSPHLGLCPRMAAPKRSRSLLRLRDRSSSRCRLPSIPEEAGHSPHSQLRQPSVLAGPQTSQTSQACPRHRSMDDYLLPWPRSVLKMPLAWAPTGSHARMSCLLRWHGWAGRARPSPPPRAEQEAKRWRQTREWL